ncbi:MAG: prepilin-type N-terminal cleavage/methylation domain-containing protein [Fimbriimonadales bacterium]|nr:prepilin-type N-terminal cleavage/methylation domain-containing protein [Fimbriimonadales bacterium]MDW8051475.1 prepilin-type N-terminal cleavage/methylation domain-containing protein [Armatimonadota bacterium]
MRGWQAHWKVGFTLVELLVVIAITAILLGLLLIPLVRGFQLTRQGQAQAQAQDVIRLALSQLSSDLKRAAYVFDCSDRIIYLPVRDRNGTVVRVPMRHAIIDMVAPAYGDPAQESNDPTSDIPIGPNGEPDAELAIPISPGRTIIRYFIGLMDNEAPYLNPEETRFVEATQRENYAILYRAEFRLYVRDGDRWVLNRELFDRIEDLFDPNFFYSNDPRRRAAWRRIAKPIVPLGQVDMVNVTYTQDGRPQVEPLVQLAPALVVNQTGAPVGAETLSDEGVGTAPVQVRFPIGLWDISPESFRLVVFRSRPDALRYGQPLRYFYTAYDAEDHQWYLRYYRATPDGQVTDVPVANLTALRDMAHGNAAATPWLNTSLDYFTEAEPMAFYVNTEAGLIDMAIPWWFSYPAGGVSFKTGEYLTPFQDPRPDTTTINGRFNAAYQADPENAPNARRYVSLLDLNNDGALDDYRQNYLALPTASLVPGSEVVIGPDQRPGPNFGKPVRYQRVPSATASPGPNQYRILYQDVVPFEEVRSTMGFVPQLLRGYIEFYSDPQTPLPPNSQIVVTFYYRFNLPTDTYVADYQTRRLMNLKVGLKLYGAERPVSYSLTTQLEVPNIVQVRGR